MNTPIGISSIDLSRSVPFPDDCLNLEATQASLAQTKFGVLGPDEALDGHVPSNRMLARPLMASRPICDVRSLSSVRWSRPVSAPVPPTASVCYVCVCLFLNSLVEVTAANPREAGAAASTP
jgi:hypothetical protein